MDITYGGRLHEPVVDSQSGLKQVLMDIYNRGATIFNGGFFLTNNWPVAIHFR